MVNLPSTAVDAPKKGNASGKVERVIRSVCDDWRDQVARRHENYRKYQTGKRGKDHGAGTIRSMDTSENQCRCDDCHRGRHASQEQQIDKIETKNNFLAQSHKDHANCAVKILERRIGWKRKSCYSPAMSVQILEECCADDVGADQSDRPSKSRQKFFCRRHGETPRYGKRSRLVT